MAEKINENITLHYIPMEKLKTSTIGVFIHRPLKEEEASENALLPYVLKRGCKLCPDSESMEHYLENLYGADLKCGVLKKGEDHILYFTAESISEKYAPEKEPLFSQLTALMMSVLFEPVTENGGFSSAYVAQEKKNAVERIESLKNDKRTYAAMRCIEEMCKGDSFAISKLGSPEKLRGITEKSLYEYYQAMIPTSVMDIYVCGECDPAAVKATVEDYIKDLAFTKGTIPSTGILEGDPTVRKVEEPMDVTQGKLSMGFRTNVDPNTEEYFALMVANSIFGSGAHSKLFNNVREKLSLAYYASSGLERFKGIMTVNAGIEFDKYQQAYDEIMVQLDTLKKGEVSELEYTSSINSILNSLKSCKDDQYAMQSFQLSEKVAGTNRSLDEVMDKILQVTVKDAVNAAQNIELDTVYFLKGAK